MTENAKHNQPAHMTWMDHAKELEETAEGLSAPKNEKQAEAVTQLVEDVKTAKKDVKAAVTEGRRPHMDAANQVTADFADIGPILERVEKVAVALAAGWRKEQEDKRAAEIAEAKRIQDEADEAARRAAAEADQTDIVALAEAAKLEADAKQAAQATKSAKSAKVSGGGIRMVKKHETTIDDLTVLLRHIFKVDKEAFLPLAREWAHGEAKASEDDIPGVTVRRWKEAQ